MQSDVKMLDIVSAEDNKELIKEELQLEDRFTSIKSSKKEVYTVAISVTIHRGFSVEDFINM